MNHDRCGYGLDGIHFCRVRQHVNDVNCPVFDEMRSAASELPRVRVPKDLFGEVSWRIKAAWRAVIHGRETVR